MPEKVTLGDGRCLEAVQLTVARETAVCRSGRIRRRPDYYIGVSVATNERGEPVQLRRRWLVMRGLNGRNGNAVTSR